MAQGRTGGSGRSSRLDRDLHHIGAVFDSSPVGLGVWSVEGQLVRANPVFSELLVGPDPAPVGALFESFIEPTDAGTIVAKISDVWAGTRNHFECDLRCRAPSGDVLWLRAYLIAVYGAGGEPAYLISQVFDFEARSSIHGARVEPFETISEAGPVAVVRTDEVGRVTYLNSRWAEFVDDHQQRMEDHGWRDLVRPADVTEIDRLARDSLETGRPFTLKVRALDHGVLAADSGGDDPPREFWGELRAAPTFGADGSLDGFAATLIDISTEMAVAARADQLAAVLDASLDYVVIARPTGAITYANGSALSALDITVGVEAEDATFLWDILDRDSVENYYEHAEPALESAGVWRGELRMRGRDDGTLPVSAQLLADLDGAGSIDSVSLVARDISDIKRAEAQLRELATHDTLTGLANRTLLYDRLGQALARFRRLEHGVALMYCDLDEFKPVNDELGHDAGDAVLVEIAGRILTIIRDTDTAARIGGDEFVVLVEGVRDIDLLETVAGRLITAIGRPIDHQGRLVEIGVSIGLVQADADHDDADQLMSMADRAMYEAKAAGRGRLVTVPAAGSDR